MDLYWIDVFVGVYLDVKEDQVIFYGECFFYFWFQIFQVGDVYVDMFVGFGKFDEVWQGFYVGM